jgi:hypothetical protein
MEWGGSERGRTLAWVREAAKAALDAVGVGLAMIVT